jgi:hypothetical protein
MSRKEREAMIRTPQAWARRGLTRLTEPVFPHRLTIVDNGIETAEKYLSEGKGLLILPIHGSARDVVEFLKLIFSNEVMGARRVVAPMGAHHYLPGLKTAAGITIGVGIHAVVTPHAKEVMKPAQARRHRRGMRDYVHDAVATLGRGGIVVLTPQVTRQASLGQPQGAVQLIVRRALKGGITEPALMFMGFDLEDGGKYGGQDHQGLNARRRYTVVAGPTFSLSQALREAGGLEGVEAWSFKQLSRVSPPGYAAG